MRAFLDFMDPLDGLLPFLGNATLGLCALGAVLMLCHAWFYYRSRDVLGRRLRDVFLTDAFRFVTTALFGVFSAIGVKEPGDYVPLYMLRLLAIFGSLWAAWKLFRHYAVLKQAALDAENGKDHDSRD